MVSDGILLDDLLCCISVGSQLYAVQVGRMIIEVAIKSGLNVMLTYRTSVFTYMLDIYGCEEIISMQPQVGPHILGLYIL